MFRLKSCSIFFLLLFLSEKTFSNSYFTISDSVKTKLIPFKVRDINGKHYLLQNKVYVFVMMDVECPISQFYTKYIQKLSIKYTKAGIVFLTIFPTMFTLESEVKSFNNQYSLTIPSVLDKFQYITKQLNGTITPEVFVMNSNNEIVYSGCIDDSFFALGKRNLHPQHFYLEKTLEALINHKTPLKSHVEAIGCEIQRIQ